jgi:hypothetical protein
MWPTRSSALTPGRRVVKYPPVGDNDWGESFFDRFDQDGQSFRVPTRDAYEASGNVQPGVASATPGIAIAEAPNIFVK